MANSCPRCQGKGTIDYEGEISPYTTRVLELLEKQYQVMASRGLIYGDSWKAEGPDGLMFNVLRKLRRLWKVVMLDGRVPKEDDGVDLANYAIMLVALAQVDPTAVQRMRVKAVKELFETPVSRIAPSPMLDPRGD